MNEFNLLRKTPKYRDRTALEYADDYLNGLSNIDQTTHKLSKRNGFGQYLIGEIALERSLHVPHKDSLEWIRIAKNSYTKANNSSENKTTTSTIAKAGAKLSQIDLYRKINSYERLPSQTEAVNAYRGLVSESVKYSKLSSLDPISQNNDNIELRGHLAEMSVLLLAQRFSINEMPEATWSPVQSYFSEDHGDSCINKSSVPTWDINIFTKLDVDEPIENPYKLQVKSIKNERTLENDSGANTIYVREDLRLSNNEINVAGRIINAVDIELNRPESAERLTRELDLRTEMLLESIDSFQL